MFSGREEGIWLINKYLTNTFCEHRIYLFDKARVCNNPRQVFYLHGFLWFIAYFNNILSPTHLVFSQSIAQESLEETGEADPKRDCLGVISSGFSSWKLLRDPTLVGAPWFLPRTFWQEQREPPLYISLNILHFPPMRIGDSCSRAVCWLHGTSFPPSPGPLCTGQAYAHSIKTVFYLLSTQPHCIRGGKEQRGLQFLLPSVLVLIVKHRGPTVTVDHMQRKGKFWNSSEISPTATASQAWALPSCRACWLLPLLQWELGELWSLSNIPHLFHEGGMWDWRNKEEKKKNTFRKRSVKGKNLKETVETLLFSSFSFFL